MLEITKPDEGSSCIACHCDNINMLIELKMAKSDDGIKNCMTICTECLSELFSKLIRHVDMYA